MGETICVKIQSQGTTERLTMRFIYCDTKGNSNRKLRSQKPFYFLLESYYNLDHMEFVEDTVVKPALFQSPIEETIDFLSSFHEFILTRYNGLNLDLHFSVASPCTKFSNLTRGKAVWILQLGY